MTTATTNDTNSELPSARTLAVTTAIALAVAVAILVTTVLPAEYGIDPLGTGEALGLKAMSRPAAMEPVSLPPGVTALKPVKNGPIDQYASSYKSDAVTLTLGPYDYVEYKYRLEEGAQMQFSWKATAPVIHDFHGELNADANAVTSFEKSNRQEAYGTLTAPFSGLIGWYWENPGGSPITVTLKSNGFYAAAIEFRSDKSRIAHELTEQ